MIRKLDIDELKKGMYVSGFEKDGPDNALFFMNSLLVRNKRDLKKFLSYGYRSAYVVVDEPRKGSIPEKRRRLGHEEAQDVAGVQEDEGLKVRPREATGDEVAVDTGETRNLVEFSEELPAARKIWAEAESLSREFMSEDDLKNSINIDNVNTTVDRMVGSITRNGDALTSLVRLKSSYGYIFGHCVNVAILAMTIGRQMRLERAKLHDLGVAAILHDVGKTLVSQKILQKAGPLTDKEFGEMKLHPELGAELLTKTPGVTEDAVSVALQHHEKFDGTGYPEERSREEIHLYARITAVADVYDAMTSDRAYQKKLRPDIVLQKMYIWRDANYEPKLLERLIKCLGIYPIGTLVELNTGEIAMVKATNHSNPLQPRLLMLFDEDKMRIRAPYELDLKTEVARWVVHSLDPKKLGVDIDPIIA